MATQAVATPAVLTLSSMHVGKTHDCSELNARYSTCVQGSSGAAFVHCTPYYQDFVRSCSSLAPKVRVPAWHRFVLCVARGAVTLRPPVRVLSSLLQFARACGQLFIFWFSPPQATQELFASGR